VLGYEESLSADILLDSRELEVTRHRVVVEPDDRNIRRYAQANSVQHAQRPKGHLVGFGEYGGGRLGSPEQLSGGLLSAFDREGSARLQLGADRQVRRSQGGFVTGSTLERDSKVHRLVRVTGDESDAFVPQVDEVLDSRPRASNVVYADAGEAIDLGTYHAHGHVERVQSVDLRLSECQGDEQYPVYTLSEDPRREVLLAHLWVTDVAEQKVEASLSDHLLGRTKHLGKKPPRQVGHDDRDGACTTRSQTVRGWRNAVPEAFCCRLDALGGGFGHSPNAPQGTRHA
jgi:hypothetical protein